MSVAENGNELLLGREKGKRSKLRMPTEVLLRHAALIGASGSGKTVLGKVLCEEVALAGVPVIAVDPQGDIASLARFAAGETVTENGGDAERARRFAEKVEVVIWTPACSAAVPLCLNPLGFDFSEEPRQRIREISLLATALTQLIDYDPRKADARSISAMLDLVITWCADNQLRPRDFSELASLLESLPSALSERVADVITDARLAEAIRRLHTLGVGARRLLFSHGTPLDIATLFGKEGDAEEPGRTRISVIYLNSLGSEQERAFFLAELARSLQAWMLDHPSRELQGLFYIDEIAAFLPPVRKPACKDALKQLFKQARKYGIGCVMATQNPGDVDYKAFSQFSTWALGRLLTDQDRSKVDQTVKAMAPDRASEILGGLPTLKAGSFVMLSPDAYGEPVPLRTRWLYSEHATLQEDELEELVSEEQRARFQKRSARLLRAQPVASLEEQLSGAAASPDEAEAQLGLAEGEEPAGPAQQQQKQILQHLRDHREALTRQELAEACGLVPKIISQRLGELQDGGLVETRRRGRQHVWFAAEHHYHPRIGLIESLELVPRVTSETEALPAAHSQIEKTLFVVQREEVSAGSARLVHFPLWKCQYTGFKRKGPPLFRKLVQASDNLYMHPCMPDICVLTRGDGFSFITTPDEENPLDVKDIDDVSRLESGSTRGVDFVEEAFNGLMEEGVVVDHFSRKFHLSVEDLRLIYLPLWEFTLDEKMGDGSRRIWVDAVKGKPFHPFGEP